MPKNPRTDIPLVAATAGVFGTGLRAETEDRMVFDFPKTGMKYDTNTGQRSPAPFPKTPKGFSGGGCFGVVKTGESVVQVGYKLLGIQYAWDKMESVFAVAIKRWCELVTAKGMA